MRDRDSLAFSPPRSHAIRYSSLLCLGLLSFTAACADETPTTSSAAKAIVVVDPGALIGAVGGKIRVTVRVVDAEQRGVRGVLVTFAVPALSGTLNTTLVSSNSDGEATVTWTVPTFPGSYPITATAKGLTALTVSAQVTVGPPITMTILSGDTLTGLVGTATDTVLAVKIVDQLGYSLGGQLVTFTVASGGGTVSRSSTTTEADGIATTIWTLGAAPGIQTLTIVADGFANRSVTAVALVPPTPRLVSVGPVFSYACRIDPAKTASCWGSNRMGSLGTGDTLPRTGPTVVAGGQQYTAIASRGISGRYGGNTCALTTAGAVWCWGPTPETFTTTERILISGLPPLSVFDMGGMFGCGLDTEGYAWCWGSNDSGQLGVGDTAPRSAPTRVASSLRFHDIVAGDTHACGLTRTGVVFCWGSNASGQIGDASTLMRTLPKQIIGTSRFLTLDAGPTHSCAVSITGGLFCWGHNANGEVTGLGNTGEAIVGVPRHVQTTNSFTRVSIGAQATCAVRTVGAPLCWGLNTGYRLGAGDTQWWHLAGAISGTTDFTEIRIGRLSSCGTTPSGAVHCWGENDAGLLGTPSILAFTAPQAVSGGNGYSQVATGYNFSCAMRNINNTWCWGSNRYGQLGTGNTMNALQPVAISSAPTFTTIAAAVESACGLDPAGGVWCWGWGRGGEIGDGNFVDRSQPTQVNVPPVTTLSFGRNHACALTAAGTAWCWGGIKGGGGEIPIAHRPFALPAAVIAPEPLFAVSAGYELGCGIGSSGTGYCWPTRTSASPATATAVHAGTTFANLTTFDTEGCFVTVTSAVRCFDIFTGASSPAAIPFGNYAPIGAIRCGSTTDGVSSCWRLGTPTPSGLTWLWNRVSIGFPNNRCGVPTNESTVYCWGDNYDGQLGLGIDVTANRYFPVPVLVP